MSTAEESLALIKGAFEGSDEPAAQKAAAIIALNAGAAIYVSGLAMSLKDGVAMAEDALATGAANDKLKELVEFSAL